MKFNTWLDHDRFGMFIHWGLYSLGARHEWLQKLEAIHPDKYQEYMKNSILIFIIHLCGQRPQITPA